MGEARLMALFGAIRPATGRSCIGAIVNNAFPGADAWLSGQLRADSRNEFAHWAQVPTTDNFGNSNVRSAQVVARTEAFSLKSTALFNRA
jgi:hypothetical protein